MLLFEAINEPYLLEGLHGQLSTHILTFAATLLSVVVLSHADNQASLENSSATIPKNTAALIPEEAVLCLY